MLYYQFRIGEAQEYARTFTSPTYFCGCLGVLEGPMNSAMHVRTYVFNTIYWLITVA